MSKIIFQGQEFGEGFSTHDVDLLEKVGEETLITEAQTCSGAINELKSNLTDLEQVSYKTGTSAYSQHLGNFGGDFDNYAYRVGNIVYFNLFVNSIGSNLPIGTAFATFVEEFRPSRRVAFYTTIYHTNAVKHTGVAIGTDGTITANQVISSNFVISGSFPIG